MNLISSNCTASTIMSKIIKKPFNNPFTWCTIDFEDMIYLIKNYELINFNNIEIIYNETDFYYSLIIDKNVKVNYVHYLTKEKNHDKMDIVNKNIKEYVINKYYERLNRMIDNPIFILSSSYVCSNQFITVDKLQKICEIKNKKIIIPIHKKTDISKFNIPPNIKIIIYDLPLNSSDTDFMLSTKIYEVLNENI